MRIAIMGSGGVGGYAGAWLQQAGVEVHFMARGAHLAARQRQASRIEHPEQPEQPKQPRALARVAAAAPLPGPATPGPTAACRSLVLHEPGRSA